MGMAAILVMWPGPFEQTCVPPSQRSSTWNLTLIGQGNTRSCMVSVPWVTCLQMQLFGQCSWGDGPLMELYGQCSWGDGPSVELKDQFSCGNGPPMDLYGQRWRTFNGAERCLPEVTVVQWSCMVWSVFMRWQWSCMVSVSEVTGRQSVFLRWRSSIGVVYSVFLRWRASIGVVWSVFLRWRTANGVVWSVFLRLQASTGVER